MSKLGSLDTRVASSAPFQKRMSSIESSKGSNSTMQANSGGKTCEATGQRELRLT